jgi:methionine--tRNA ligase beta chain
MKMTIISPVKPTISFDSFDKIDIRVGTIISVEELKESEKLVKLKVDFGNQQRQILAGLKGERQNPREIEGRQALFVVNLEPKEMFGELS